MQIQFHVWFGLINIKIIQILSRHIRRHCICKFLFFFKWQTDFLIICFKDKLLRLFCPPPPPSKIIFTRFVYIRVKSQIAISWYFCCFNKKRCVCEQFLQTNKKTPNNLWLPDIFESEFCHLYTIWMQIVAGDNVCCLPCLAIS